MLNGKFYTGLPPKMIERGGAGGPNRLESHLFWPDDTKTETAAESRTKRRSSLQLASDERPLYDKQNSAIDSVDTRKRFSKEFSQSSIQFYDNLNEDNSRSRRSMLRSSGTNRRMDITEKPTNTKIELPDNVVTEAYTAAKKKQAYTSKIEFYDYANDHEGRNNLRKPKMDMNDKREMELNAKNSPKLQVKRDVRSLSEEKEQPKINNHEVQAMERQVSGKMDDINERRREHILNNDDSYLRSRRSMEPRMNVSPKRSLAKAINNKRYSCERDVYREPDSEPEPLSYVRNYAHSDKRFPRRNNEQGNVSESGRYYSTGEYDNFDDNSFHSLRRADPRRAIKNNARHYYETPDDSYYSQPYEDAAIRHRMRNISLKSTKPPQKPHHPAEEYYDDASYYSRNDEVETPTNRGSFYTRYDHNEREDNEPELSYKNYNNNTKRFPKNNKPSVTNIKNKFQRETVASPTSLSPPPSDAESSVSATKMHRHLRSSLCFNNGEIIAENDATTSPTLPTSSAHNQTQRRNARSSATQRVSVGLPD